MRYLSRQAKFDDSTHEKRKWKEKKLTRNTLVRKNAHQTCNKTTNIKPIEVVNKRLSLCHLWSQHGKYLHVCRTSHSFVFLFCIDVLLAALSIICCLARNRAAHTCTSFKYWFFFLSSSVAWFTILLPVHLVSSIIVYA